MKNFIYWAGMMALTTASPTWAGGDDLDNDGVADSIDNCVTSANANQTDTDGDGFGNACDADFNNDCVVNPVDLAELKSMFFSTSAEHDLNGDGFVNAADLAFIRRDYLQAPGPSGLRNCTYAPITETAVFETGFDDWAPAFALSLAGIGGNPGGYVQFIDPGLSGGAWLSAPTSWLGDWSNLVGISTVRMSHKIFDWVPQGIPVRVEITGANGQVRCSGPMPSGTTDWVELSVPVSETDCEVRSGTFNGAISAVTSVRIKSAASNSRPDITGIDNIRLESLPASRQGDYPVIEQ